MKLFFLFLSSFAYLSSASLGAFRRRLDTPSSAPWDYDKKTSNWQKSYEECKSTVRQSPIDIETSKVTPMKDLTISFDYERPKEAYISDNSKTILTQFANWQGGKMRLQRLIPAVGPTGDTGGKEGKKEEKEIQDYSLLQWHVHSPSEHTIDSRKGSLELHLVHQNLKNPSDLAVVGLIFDVVKSGETANEKFSKFFSFIDENLVELHAHQKSGDETTKGDETVHGSHHEALETVKRKVEEREKFSIIFDELNDMTSNNQILEFYHYLGSLTTPPCSEIVSWFVLKDPIQVTATSVDDLLETLRSISNGYGNARPIQNVHNTQPVYLITSLPFPETFTPFFAFLHTINPFSPFSALSPPILWGSLILFLSTLILFLFLYSRTNAASTPHTLLTAPIHDKKDPPYLTYA